MPIYHQLGEVPRKRHLAFRKEDGGIHYEELVGNKGFTGPSSLLYHLRLPTAVKSVEPLQKAAASGQRHRSISFCISSDPS